MTETTRPTMCISYVDRKAITGQAIINGRLVTEFRPALFHDGSENHPAGTLVCEQPTAEEMYDGIESDTVTRFGVLFWDRGVFSPRGV